MKSNASPYPVPSVGRRSLPRHGRTVFADNCRIAISYDLVTGGPCYDAKRLAEQAGLTPSTVGRILASEHAPVIDTLEAIALAFRLQLWQMLVPDLDPSNPPTVPYTDAERELYWRIKSAARAFARTGDVDYDQNDHPAGLRPPAVRHTNRETATSGPPPFDRRRAR